jgi:hypothetical protein
MDGEPNDTRNLPLLLKQLCRFSLFKRRRSAAGGFRPWHRKASLVEALRRDWRGGYALTEGGELAFVPAWREARGEQGLFLRL